MSITEREKVVFQNILTFQRALVGIYDLFGVIWLRKRSHSSVIIKEFCDSTKNKKEENMEISLSWLIVGFLGQLFFSARFIVQWIYSEINKKSIIPLAFWFLVF